MSGPMPTHFRWLWYLVGLAGMALTVVGVVAIIGSTADLGILVPFLVVAAIVIGYVIVRFRRSLNAAVAAAPSRRAGIEPPEAGDTGATSSTVGEEAGPASSGPSPPSVPCRRRTSRRDR